MGRSRYGEPPLLASIPAQGFHLPAARGLRVRVCVLQVPLATGQRGAGHAVFRRILHRLKAQRDSAAPEPAPYPRAPMIIIFRSTFLLASMDGPCGTRAVTVEQQRGAVGVGARRTPATGGSSRWSLQPPCTPQHLPVRPKPRQGAVLMAPVELGTGPPCLVPAWPTSLPGDRLPGSCSTPGHAAAGHELISMRSCCGKLPRLLCLPLKCSSSPET